MYCVFSCANYTLSNVLIPCLSVRHFLLHIIMVAMMRIRTMMSSTPAAVPPATTATGTPSSQAEG